MELDQFSAKVEKNFYNELVKLGEEERRVRDMKSSELNIDLFKFFDLLLKSKVKAIELQQKKH